MALFKKDRERAERGIAAVVPDAARPDSAGVSTASINKGAAGAFSDASSSAQDGQPRKGIMMGSYGAGAEKLPAGDNANSSAFLGKGTKITGKIALEGNARIEGHVEGEIVASDTLAIGESAVVNAQISGVIVVITGKVTGDISASKKVEIRTPGRLYGNIVTPSLVIEEGVVFEGHCSMGATEKSDRKVTLLSKEDKPAEAISPIALKAQWDGK